jgi:hypothetical protein
MSRVFSGISMSLDGFVTGPPVLLGSGTRLFEHLGRPVRLERESVITTPTTTHLRFRVLG